MKSLIRAFVVLAATAWVSTGIAAEATKVKIIYTVTSGYLGSFVAKDQGFFAKRGLDVDFTLTTNGSLILAALVSGSAQVGTPTGTVFVQGADSGLDVVALATTSVMPETVRSGLVVRKNSGITGANDLVGKKIGVPGIGGMLDVLLRRWLIENKVDLKKVTFVELGFPQMPDALRGAQVDGVASVDPFLTRATSSGAGDFLTDYAANIPAGAATSFYTATRDFVTAHPGFAKAFQEAIVEANTFVVDHPDAARESLVRYSKLPPEVVAGMALPRLAAKLSPDQVKFWIDVCREQNLISGNPDPAKLAVPWQAGS